jgi:hypothetical protein
VQIKLTGATFVMLHLYCIIIIIILDTTVPIEFVFGAFFTSVYILQDKEVS